jgi:NCAIR mutase (PurE)-related protein
LDRQRLKELLEGVRDGRVDVEQGLARLRSFPFEELGHTRLDTQRDLRCGFPEVVLGRWKEPRELVEIALRHLEHHDRLFVTRVDAERAAALLDAVPGAVHHRRARAVTVGTPVEGEGDGLVLVLSAGTADGPVAEEAALTARCMGARAELLLDVGVAGIHRLLAETERIARADALVVVAGMEGALASVVGGLVDVPVIAVPTSIGYGASFEGIAPLLTMLSSCAAGVTVVNIDNGFGAGFAAARIATAVREVVPT